MRMVILIGLAIATVVLAALFAGSSILFDRSMREPIEGAYVGAPREPATATRPAKGTESATAPTTRSTSAGVSRCSGLV